MVYGFNCHATEELWFPPELVSGTEEIADISRFNRGEQMPGIYKVSIYLNRELLGIRDMQFIPADTEEKRMGITDRTGLMASLTLNDLLSAGVRPEAFGNFKDEAVAETPLSPGRVIPHSTTHFDFQQMRLDISIPQKWIKKRPRGWVPPERWDDGITAGLLNWSFSGSNTHRRYGNSSSYYLRLNSGINYGPWRLRDERTLNGGNYMSSLSHQWRQGRTWIERGLRDWRSSFTIGDVVTGGEVFDSTSLLGVSLMTNNDMYPDTERGYAPVVRGIALTNARVSIRQNGYIVYETNVAPGEFAIDDINSMYSSGDLEVSVTESDGNVRVFTVPYATLPILLREGRIKYALNAGRLHKGSQKNTAPSAVVQGTLALGLPHRVTTYGGMQASGNYSSVALGSGINMGVWGAFSADVTHADSRLADNSRHSGQSIRFLYSRGFESTGTTFQLAGYRYSTKGFYTLEESHRSYMSGWRWGQLRDASGRVLPQQVTNWYDLKDKRREKIEANISQRVVDSGSLYLSGSRQTYWHTNKANTSFEAGYSSSLGPLNYTLNYSESYSSSLRQTDRGINLSLSVPLDRLFSGAGKSMSASFNTGRDGNGEVTQQSGISGSALEFNKLNWSVYQGYSRRGGNSNSLRADYRGGYGNVAASYGQGRDFRQVSYAASGGMIIHSGGVTAGQSLGNTAVLVSVPGSTGVPLLSGSGIKTDWRGYAIGPWAREYEESRVAIDVAHLDARTEIERPVVRVIPTKGAIVRAEFAAKTGLRVLMTLKKNGKPLPFGTTVSTGQSSSIVGDEGQVYLTGLSPSGTLTAKWGNNTGQFCQATWNFSQTDTRAPLLAVAAACK
ncbi:fimbria/pilus outer membrane usher protein [Pantoea ananatis]|nr:fimbria/pilus outer membrane usher protein [Pantoea ananatis]MDI6539624.1 fimbria/pilus outer membrane usher protein [Pantoea ananatis]